LFSTAARLARARISRALRRRGRLSTAAKQIGGTLLLLRIPSLQLVDVLLDPLVLLQVLLLIPGGSRFLEALNLPLLQRLYRLGFGLRGLSRRSRLYPRRLSRCGTGHF